MTVLPQPKAPGMAVVPPCGEKKHGHFGSSVERRTKTKIERVAKPNFDLDAGEERVEDPLTRQQGMIGRQFLGDGTHLTNGPNLQHPVLGFLAVKFNFQNGVGD